MSEKISRTEFSESLDRRLSGLQGDPWLAAKVLAKAEGEEPMKKKISTTAILIIALLAIMTVGALAAAAVTHWGVIRRLMDEQWNVNEEALVSPLKAESDIQSLRFTATEAYWTEDGLTVAFKTECTDPDCLPYYEEGEHPELIEFNGETITQDELRGDKDLIACEIIWPALDCWTWYEYTDEGLFISVTIMEPDAEKLEKGMTLSYQCWCENLQTGERESGTITVELPAMTMQEGHRETDDYAEEE